MLTTDEKESLREAKKLIRSTSGLDLRTQLPTITPFYTARHPDRVDQALVAYTAAQRYLGRAIDIDSPMDAKILRQAFDCKAIIKANQPHAYSFEQRRQIVLLAGLQYF